MKAFSAAICDQLCAGMEDAHPDILKIDNAPFTRRRRRFKHALMYHIRDRVQAGETDPEKLADSTVAFAESQYASIVSILLLAVVVAIVQWCVKKFLDWYFDRHEQNGAPA